MTASATVDAPAKSAAVPLSVHARLWFAVTVWGGSFVAARALLSASGPGQAVLTPVVLAALRFGIASACFLVPLARAILRREISPGNLLRMAVLGQITYSLYFWLQYTGVQQTNASIASILVVGLIPLATALLATALGHERLTPATVAALLLGLAGVALIVLPGVQLGSDGSFLFGAACLVGNALAFALYANLSKRWMSTVSPLVMTGGTMLFGAFGLLALALADPAANSWMPVTRLDPTQWLALLFLALVCSVAAYFAYNTALTRVPASRAASYVYFEPVVAVVLGAVLLGERLSPQAVAGAVVIALSVILLQRRHRADARRARLARDAAESG